MSTEKRPAFEPPALLADEHEQPVTPSRRPAAVTTGAVLIVLRVLAGILWLVSLAVEWDRILRDDLDLEVEDVDVRTASDLVLAIIVVAGAVVLAVQLVLAWLVFRGVDWARILVMIISSLSITISGVDYFAGGQDITLRTTLLTLALDILVLFALSSRAARAWSQRSLRRSW